MICYGLYLNISCDKAGIGGM